MSECRCVKRWEGTESHFDVTDCPVHATTYFKTYLERAEQAERALAVALKEAVNYREGVKNLSKAMHDALTDRDALRTQLHAAQEALREIRDMPHQGADDEVQHCCEAGRIAYAALSPRPPA